LATIDPGILFQNEIRQFLTSVGFSNVPPANQHLTLGGQEIDAFGRDSDFYVVIDAKTRGSFERRGRNVRSYLSIVNGYKNEVIQDIRRQFESTYGYRDTALIFWTKDIKIEADHQQRAKELGIALRDHFDLEYYRLASGILQNKEIVRNSFLKDLKLQLPTLAVFSERHSINVKAIRTRIGAKTFYTFPIEVEHLLRFSYVFRVEMNTILGESYQRLLKENKIDKIRGYIQGGGYFPNNIIVASEESLVFVPEEATDQHAPYTLGELRLPNKPCYLEILDGQHRLYGYSNQPIRRDQCLWVTVVEGLSPEDRAKLFVSINKTQTPVPAFILWDLFQISEPASIRGRISKFVYELNDLEPLKDLISLPRIRSSKAYLSFPNFCSSLATRTNLFSQFGAANSFMNVIRGYFEVISNDPELRGDWDRCISEKGKRGFICTNNSISVLLRLLSNVLRKTGLPPNERIASWKSNLNDWVIVHLKAYLSENATSNQTDPYGGLRSELTSEKARKDTAEDIWRRSPLYRAGTQVNY